MSPAVTFRNHQDLNQKRRGTSLPISLVACEAGGAFGHALSPVDDKVHVYGQVHLGAQVHGDAAPALELVGVRGTVWYATTLVVVVEAGGAGHVVVGLGAAAQALAVATLPFVRAGELAVVRAHWRRQRKDGREVRFGWIVNSLHRWSQE